MANAAHAANAVQEQTLSATANGKDAFGKVLQPGSTGLFTPGVTYQAKTYTQPALAEATAGMADTESFVPENATIDADSNIPKAVETLYKRASVKDPEPEIKISAKEQSAHDFNMVDGTDRAIKEA